LKVNAKVKTSVTGVWVSPRDDLDAVAKRKKNLFIAPAGN
jgi:hypothetical protein